VGSFAYAEPATMILGLSKVIGPSFEKARVIIEYDLLPGDRVMVRDREEQRWTACETVIALPGSTVKVELLEVPLMPDYVPSATPAVV
jgi:hypothetical protein